MTVHGSNSHNHDNNSGATISRVEFMHYETSRKGKIPQSSNSGQKNQTRINQHETSEEKMTIQRRQSPENERKFSSRNHLHEKSGGDFFFAGSKSRHNISSDGATFVTHYQKNKKIEKENINDYRRDGFGQAENRQVNVSSRHTKLSPESDYVAKEQRIRAEMMSKESASQNENSKNIDNNDGQYVLYSDTSSVTTAGMGFDETEWTPQDSAYGAAFPCCGWIPKRTRQAIESTIIALAFFIFVFLVVKFSIAISTDSSNDGNNSNQKASDASAYANLDDNFYIDDQKDDFYDLTDDR
mmetsp:Transcript_10947/g.15407  ORF Transcript_10947/g.15407 Transcript_10947/m.15407 type:complete len:298 (+) Transcript_10947:129-1022(+)